MNVSLHNPFLLIPYDRGGQPTASGPHAVHKQFLCGPPGPQRKKIMCMNIMCTFNRVVGASRDKNQNSFSARGGFKVAHHCPMTIVQLNMLSQAKSSRPMTVNADVMMQLLYT